MASRMVALFAFSSAASASHGEFAERKGGAAVLPRLPLRVADSWPKPFSGNLYPGDARAVVQVPAGFHGKSVDVQVFWRLREPVANNPNAWTSALVTDDAGVIVNSSTKVMRGACGVVAFDVQPSSTYYIYPWAHYQWGGGAGLHFKWLDCKKSSNDGGATWCDAVEESASWVVALESRDVFHGVTEMEQVALPSEVAAVLAGHSAPLLTFPEPRERAVRLLHSAEMQADWALQGPRDKLVAAATMGEYFTFQVGVYATAAVTVTGAQFSDLVNSAGHALTTAGSLTCFNLQGVDLHGNTFRKNYTLAPRRSGSLWFGMDLPASGNRGSYSTRLKIEHSAGEAVIDLHLNVSASTASRDSDIFKLERLRWLNSRAGAGDIVPAPYENVTADPTPTGLNVSWLNKELRLGANGLPTSLQAHAVKQRGGQLAEQAFDVLDGSVSFVAVAKGGSALQMEVQQEAQLHEAGPSRAAWSATSSGASLVMSVSGSAEFDSFISFAVKFTAHHDVELEDIQMRLPVSSTAARWICGMGKDGGRYTDLTWKWQFGSAQNSLWLGRPEAGLRVRLNGEGDVWMSPMFGKDDAEIPYVPTSWGGVDGASGRYGASVTNRTFVTTSGPRLLKAGHSVKFLFDLVATPSRPVNFTKHWRNRQFQIGYGAASNFESPEMVAARGATVATLHQGVQGVVNDTLVNPYINYPFTPKEVELMHNFSDQAWKFGVAMKYYYTVRELSNHVVELFPLLSLDGEVFLDTDPRTIPQKAYCQDELCHGGDVFLHEHVVTNYTFCWQQALSNGEWDAALCDTGDSRWFNYYVEGLRWAISNPPFVSGIYYDGINFGRSSFQRVRRAADAAAAESGRRLPHVLFDLHTGRGGGTGYQPCLSYLTHYAYVDSLWNGEGFPWTAMGPDFWLVEASGLPMGLTADSLGGGAYPYQAMVFGMTERNSKVASALWKFWDEVGIEETTMVGWWEDDAVATVHASSINASSSTFVTAYVAYGKRTVLVVATWHKQAEDVSVQVDWKALGLAPASAGVVPAIVGLQQAAQSVSLSALTLPGLGGKILVLEKEVPTYV